MKKNVLCLSFFVSLIFLISPLLSSEFTKEDIKTEIDKHFEQSKGGIKFATEIEPNSSLTTLGNDFFKENKLYIDYISRQSEEYMDKILYLFELYLISKDCEISGFVEKPKQEISIHDLKATGVRFFYPTKVTEDGKIGTRICVTGEGFRDYEKREIYLEAFSFHTIFNEILKKQDSYILPRVSENNELANQLKLSDNNEDLLKRAQGFMWALFYADSNFEKILLDAYHEKEIYLPFKITH